MEAHGDGEGRPGCGGLAPLGCGESNMETSLLPQVKTLTTLSCKRIKSLNKEKVSLGESHVKPNSF